jgi:23S rRNA (cytidine1920-2'-O)/16S rRNA (cytidine1409-2'-O)-methyltransferase
VAKAPRAKFVALTALIRTRFPEAGDPSELIRAGRVLVNNAPAQSPTARVRATASVRILEELALRGTRKLSAALLDLSVEVGGRAALDLGAAAGGFTRALLDAGARRVYAVDVGVGQLRGSLRRHPRVVNLERTNLADLDLTRIPEPIGIVTMDLSYLSVADALPQLDRQLLAADAHLLALVKPTFELRAGRLAAEQDDVVRATTIVVESLLDHGWQLRGVRRSAVRGSKGAVEMFVLAQLR